MYLAVSPMTLSYEPLDMAYETLILTKILGVATNCSPRVFLFLNKWNFDVLCEEIRVVGITFSVHCLQKQSVNCYLLIALEMEAYKGK